MSLYKILDALKTKQWIDLTHTVHAKIPHFSGFDELKEKTVKTLTTDNFYSKEYTFPTQYGTHIDAPIHFVAGGRYLDEIELQELVLPLYVIHKEKEIQKNPDYVLSLKDIKDFEIAYGRIKEHSFIAFASGWSDRWYKEPDNFYNLDKNGIVHTPGWSLEALQFLCEERNIKAIGHETLDTDPGSAFYNETDFLPAEYYVLAKNCYQIEVLNNLAKLPATGSIIFSLAPKFKQSPGFPVRSFAICDSL